MHFDFRREAAKSGEPRGGNAGSIHSRRFGDRLAPQFVRIQPRLPRGIRPFRKTDVHGNHVVRLESQRGVDARHKRPHRRARRGQQHQRQRDLAGNQQPVRISIVRAAGVLRVARLDQITELRPRKLPGR